MDEELSKLEELRNEIHNRQLRGIISQNQVHLVDAQNVKTVQGGKEENNETKGEEQNGMDESETVGNYQRYEYEGTFGQDVQETEEGNDIDIEKVLTIAISLHNYSYKDLLSIDKLFTGITTLYPGIKTVVYSPIKLDRISSTNRNITLITLEKQIQPGQIWRMLLEQINTTCVLILRNVVDFDEHSRVRNLLFNLENLKLDLVGGSSKNMNNGHWDMGCSQMAYRNYILVHKAGYRHSKNSCIYCHNIDGPFVAKASLLKQYNFTNLFVSEELLFHDFFFNQYKNQSKFAVCPDSMFHTRAKTTEPDRDQWLKFAVENNVHRLKTAQGKTFTYSCDELGVEKNSIDDGKSVPFCTIQELINHIKFIMRMCRENLIICELSWGIELGAVKLNSVAPWEHDGDISFYTPQAEKLMALETIFSGTWILTLLSQIHRRMGQPLAPKWE